MTVTVTVTMTLTKTHKTQYTTHTRHNTQHTHTTHNTGCGTESSPNFGRYAARFELDELRTARLRVQLAELTVGSVVPRQPVLPPPQKKNWHFEGFR